MDVFLTYLDVDKNSDFRFDDPTLTVCNLIHGRDTICFDIFRQSRRMGLSNGGSLDPPGASPFEGFGGGGFCLFLKKNLRNFKK